MEASSPDDVAKGWTTGQEQNVARVDSPDRETEVVDVDTAYLTSSTWTKIYRGVLFQMFLL